MEFTTSDYNYISTLDSNDTDYPEEPCDLDPQPAMIITQTYIHAIICAFGLIGNTLVLVTYLFYKRTKTMTDVYLVNMAVADLIFVVALPFIIYNEQQNWSMSAAACKILGSAYSINLYSGMLLLVCISGDRYIAIVRARKSFGARSQALVYSRLICSAVWVFALTLTLPTFIYTERFEEIFRAENATVYMCQLSFSESEKAKLVKTLVPSLQMTIGFLLPLLVMVFCYSNIMYTLLQTQNSQKHKAIRVVLAVVIVFILCHLPYNVALLDHTLSLFKQRGCQAEKIKLQVLAVSKGIAYLHCCLNPIIYAFIGVKFRNHFQQIMLDLWCFSKKYIVSSRATSDICVSGPKTSDGINNMSSFTV